MVGHIQCLDNKYSRSTIIAILKYYLCSFWAV